MSTEPLDDAFETLRDEIARDAELESEFRASRGSFFRRRRALRPGAEARLADRRHLEWFLLERDSRALGGIPLQALIDRARSRGATVDERQRASLAGSHASVFEVLRAEPGRGVWLRDLAGLADLAADEPEAACVLQRGDTVAGRVYEREPGLYRLSPAAAFFRDARLLEALRSDLARARAGRRAVLRLPQSDLESMFFGAGSEPPGEDPVGEARSFLVREAGFDEGDAEEVLEALGADTPDVGPLTAEAAIGEILDRLAFDTGVDLEDARRVLWNAHIALAQAAPGSGPLVATLAPRSSPRGVAEVLAEFERRRDEGASAEQACAELERALQLEEVTGSLDEEDSEAPDFPGVVGALVEEFLWEVEREHGPERARELGCVRSLGRYGAALGLVEELDVTALLDFAARWLPESGDIPGADAARAHLAALAAFCRWAEAEQGLPLAAGFGPYLRQLGEALPRVAEANRRATRTADRREGDAFTLQALHPDGRARLAGADAQAHDAAVDPLLAEWLVPGDRLRGRRLSDGRLAVYCAYPGLEPIADG